MFRATELGRNATVLNAYAKEHDATQDNAQNIPQHIATEENTLQHTATHEKTQYNTPHHTTSHCNALHHTVTVSMSDVRHCNTPQHTATHCNSVTTQCNTLQHTATHCNTLQHSTTQCNIILLRLSGYRIRIEGVGWCFLGMVRACIQLDLSQ